MRPAHALLALLAGLSLACAGGHEPTEPDPTAIEGIWFHEGDNGTDLLRTIVFDDYTGSRVVDEYVYVNGVPEQLRHGAAHLRANEPIAGGLTAELALVIYYDDSEGYPGGVGYDTVERLDDHRMVLRGVYVDEPVSFERLSTMP